MMSSGFVAASGSPKASAVNASIAGAYALFFVTGFLVYHFVAEGEISVLCTLGVKLQFVSYLMLVLRVSSSGSVAGISAQTLVLSAASHCCRLSSTLFLVGYLPVDASGDWIFQTVDIASLAVVVFLLYQVLVQKRASYQATDDTVPIWPLALGAFACACMFHADMNHWPLMDIMWFAGLYIDAVAMVPQLWLIGRSGGGKVEALMSHHIFTLVVSRLLSGYFWYLAAEYVKYTAWFLPITLGGWSILLGHAVHFLLLADVVYTYVKACVLTGIPGLGGTDIICAEV